MKYHVTLIPTSLDFYINPLPPSPPLPLPQLPTFASPITELLQLHLTSRARHCRFSPAPRFSVYNILTISLLVPQTKVNFFFSLSVFCSFNRQRIGCFGLTIGCFKFPLFDLTDRHFHRSPKLTDRTFLQFDRLRFSSTTTPALSHICSRLSTNPSINRDNG